MSIHYYEETSSCVKEGDIFKRSGSTFNPQELTSRGSRNGRRINIIHEDKIELLNNTDSYFWVRSTRSSETRVSASVSEFFHNDDNEAIRYEVIYTDSENSNNAKNA